MRLDRARTGNAGGTAGHASIWAGRADGRRLPDDSLFSASHAPMRARGKGAYETGDDASMETRAHAGRKAVYSLEIAEAP